MYIMTLYLDILLLQATTIYIKYYTLDRARHEDLPGALLGGYSSGWLCQIKLLLDKPYTFGYSGTCEGYVHGLVSFDLADPIPTSFAGAVAPLPVVPVQAAKI